MVFANMGIPVVCVTLPIMLLALLPIAVIESAVYYKHLDRSFKDAFWGAVISNLWSTLVGVPFTWFLVLLLQLSIGGGSAWGMETSQQRLEAVTLQAAWLIPYQEHLAWMIPAASLALLLPFYLGSVVVEYMALVARWRSLARTKLFLSVAVANGLSYACLACYYGIELYSRLN